MTLPRTKTTCPIYIASVNPGNKYWETMAVIHIIKHRRKLKEIKTETKLLKTELNIQD